MKTDTPHPDLVAADQPVNRWLRRLGLAIPRLLLLLVAVYLFGLLIYDGPGQAAGLLNWILATLWVAGFGFAWVHFRRRAFRVRFGILLALIGLILIPWSFISPSNDREWKPEFARTGWVEQEGDELTFHNYRDFTYAENGEVEERWLTKRFNLSNLQGVCLFHDAFGGTLAAHPIFSFDFGEQGFLVLSIETRREVGESFSVFGGLYKLFELQYLFGSERDFVGVRTNIRDEPVYRYRLHNDLDHARQFLLDAIEAQNELRERPRFYNILTANCTTSLRAQTEEASRQSLDWRMLINGRFDEYLHEQGLFETEETDFKKVRAAAFLNDKAKDADFSSEASFSHDIRK